MKNVSFYDQVGVLVPGSTLLFGMMFYFPALRDAFAKDGVTIGGLGIFVVISYAAGHLLAALGNALETIYWRTKGGMPSNWIVGHNPRLLAPTQVTKIHEIITSRFGLTLAPLADTSAKSWYPIFRQIYSDVEKHGKPSRGDAFNGMYGLNRGLCAATLSLAVIVLAVSPSSWITALCLLLGSGIYLYRMQRFGVHYAREIYNQFLLLPLEIAKPARALASRSKPQRNENKDRLANG